MSDEPHGRSSTPDCVVAALVVRWMKSHSSTTLTVTHLCMRCYSSSTDGSSTSETRAIQHGSEFGDEENSEK